MFLGYVTLESTAYWPLVTVNTSSVPTAADAAPTRVVYAASSGGRLDSAAGQAADAHTGTITDATNTNPIVITSATHGLQTGARVTITNVGGNTAANTTATITRVSANTFSLDGVAGNGAYTSGGTFKTTGHYAHQLACTAANGFARGTYFIYSAWAISSSARAQVDSFTVI